MTIQEFLFDVDGTLTEPRKRMSEDHARLFIDTMKSSRYSIVSGSDYAKLQEQLPDSILIDANYVFASMGNEVYQHGNILYSNIVEFPVELIKDLDSILETSQTIKTGNHIEQRWGMINFSTIGRNCTQKQREEYYEWDKKNSERLNITTTLKNKYPDYDFCIGGMISIDIIPRGGDKSQVLTKLSSDNILFFGDRIVPSGNDWSLAQEIMNTKSKYSIFQVSGPDETINILRKMI